MLYRYLPYSIFKVLFGDRRRYGLQINRDDEDFKKWLQNYNDFYKYQTTFGKTVNHYGLKIISNIDFTGKVVLEVGPGIVQHLDYNQTRPEKYVLADIRNDFLNRSERLLREKYGIDNVSRLEVSGTKIPLDDESVDVVITFHQLEHICNLKEYIKEIKRILKPDGILIGSVPTEGGIAWGLGRFFTSRRYVRKHMNFDYDKIICWEHPNFVNKIKNSLDNEFENFKSVKQPLGLLPMDFNLSWSFMYKNSKKI